VEKDFGSAGTAGCGLAVSMEALTGSSTCCLGGLTVDFLLRIVLLLESKPPLSLASPDS